MVALKPSDTISAKLLEQIEAARQNRTPGAAVPLSRRPPARSPVPANTTPPEGATISGTWNAQPGPDTSIVLTIQPGGAFTWQVTQKGQTQQFSGISTFGGGVLTLAQDNGTRSGRSRELERSQPHDLPRHRRRARPTPD